MSNYVDWFVNRLKQYQGFLKMLARETEKQIMLIEAPAELGKTWLIQRVLYECRQRSVPVVHVDFRDRRAWDYLALVLHSRDLLGAQFFNALTQCISEATTLNVNLSANPSANSNAHPVGATGGVSLAIANDGSTLSQSHVTVGDVAGGHIIKENRFLVQADGETMRRTVEVRINDAFFGCLQSLAQSQPVVFLIDTYEETTTEAERWLLSYFLSRIGNRLLPNVIAVVAGRKTPSIEAAWQPLVARTGLDFFEPAYVTEYIVQKRGLKDLDLPTILRTSGGHPGLLAKMADIAAVDKTDDKEWL